MFPTKINNAKQKESSPLLYLHFKFLTQFSTVLSSAFLSQCSCQALQGCWLIQWAFSWPHSSWFFSLSFWNTTLFWFTSYFSAHFSSVSSGIFYPVLANPMTWSWASLFAFDSLHWWAHSVSWLYIPSICWLPLHCISSLIHELQPAYVDDTSLWRSHKHLRCTAPN